MVDVDGSSQFSSDSQPKSISLIWGLAATRRSVYIQMNHVNSCNDFDHDDCVINIVVVIMMMIIIIRVGAPWLLPSLDL